MSTFYDQKNMSKKYVKKYVKKTDINFFIDDYNIM